jgi:hypothetical protein
MAVYAARESISEVWICVKVVDKASSKIAYNLRLKALNENGIIHYGASSGKARQGWHVAIRSKSFICDQVNLADLGNPWAIDFGAETEGPDNISFDRTEWQLLYIKSNSKP